MCFYQLSQTTIEIGTNPFQAMVISLPPENIRKPKVFLHFQGCAEMEHWSEMD